MGEATDEWTRQRIRRSTGLAVTMGLLLLAAPLVVMIGGFMVIASDMCSSDPDRPICSPDIQALVWQLPAGAVVVGLVIGGVLGSIAIKRDRTPYPWIVLAWALPLVALVISGNIAGAE
jgi:ABC-type branched-subunit amino acid transport system permease subunit